MDYILKDKNGTVVTTEEYKKLSKEEQFSLRVEHVKEAAKRLGIRLAPILFVILFSSALSTKTYAGEYIAKEYAAKSAQTYLSENYISVPAEIEELCIKYGAIHNIEPELLEALIWKESRFIADVQGGACKGLMQVNPGCHSRRMAKVGATDLFNPEDNIATGSDYLKELIDEYKDIDIALMLYNGDKRAGSGYVSNYAKDIIKISRYLKIAHN